MPKIAPYFGYNKHFIQHYAVSTLSCKFVNNHTSVNRLVLTDIKVAFEKSEKKKIQTSKTKLVE